MAAVNVKNYDSPAAAHRPRHGGHPTPKCEHDTDGDGDCHFCVWCVLNGGRYLDRWDYVGS